MNLIHQGDQYSVTAKIVLNGEATSPDTVDDVRMKVDEVMKTYSKGELTYSDGYWGFPLTEEMTRGFKSGVAKVQVAIKKGASFIYSNVQAVDVGYSIIGDNWDE